MYENGKENSLLCGILGFAIFECMQGLYAKEQNDNGHGRNNESKYL